MLAAFLFGCDLGPIGEHTIFCSENSVLLMGCPAEKSAFS